MDIAQIKAELEKGLTKDQARAVKSPKRCVLVVAGAGSGKTEVMARRIAWWIGVDKVPKEKIVAFTFTERAAEEMKFRIRGWLERITPAGEEVTVGGMYIGTIHGFCLAKLREFWPDEYHNYDILDEAARAALILRGFGGLLGLRALQEARGQGQYATLEDFIDAYDQLHEHNQFEVKLASDEPPIELGETESEWCKKAQLTTDVGSTPEAQAFSRSAARYHAYLRCRRFLDFSTSQSEFIRNLRRDRERLRELAERQIHLVVDEVQDINPVQRELIELLTGKSGRLTAVGDHRQSIYGFRGAKVEIIAELWERFKKASDAEIVDLRENFRSTPRIIDLANKWAATISQVRSMETPAMAHGNSKRTDQHPSHIALVSFGERTDEADWIADAIKVLVPTETEGALHDKKDGLARGLTLSDIAVLVRSSTDVRAYMNALEAAGIPCVVRAGPDLFSQPEVLFFISALATSAGGTEFFGSAYNPKSLPKRVESVLGCAPKVGQTPGSISVGVQTVLKEAAKALRQTGLPFDRKVEERVMFAAQAIFERIKGAKTFTATQVATFRTPKLRDFLTSRHSLRRVFPQHLFHMLLSEAEVETWDATGAGRGQSALFHLGALSGLITGIETPGWTSVEGYGWQIIGLCQYGAEEGRTEEQPLMVQPDAVNISTIHAVKGLEFPAVFLADVCARRFPSTKARQKKDLPLGEAICRAIDVEGLSDNDNHDGERRLMYVALTRAERFLFVSHSGEEVSRFVQGVKGTKKKPGIPGLRQIIADSGGRVTNDSAALLRELKYAPKEHKRDVRLATSFSDLRYYLECPHDFYLRKVLGFAPTIDQAFGYGRGIHNLMRAIHTNPRKWAALAKDRKVLEAEVRKLIERGLFYLRYTTGEPATNMRKKGVEIVSDYVQRFAAELQTLTFEPEKEFETLIEYEDGQGGALVSGAIDIVRQDDPPRVTLIDFKSGDPESDKHQKLDEKEMQLQVGLYAVAAKKELEYQPDQGLVRYLDAEDKSKAELRVALDDASIAKAKQTVAQTAAQIRNRNFTSGPAPRPDGKHRCGTCDFLGFCGMKEAVSYKAAHPREW